MATHLSPGRSVGKAFWLTPVQKNQRTYAGSTHYERKCVHIALIYVLRVALRMHVHNNVCAYECVYLKPVSVEPQNWLGRQ